MVAHMGSKVTIKDRFPRTTEYLRAVLVLALVVGGCLVLRRHLIPTDVAMILLLADVFVATRVRTGPALLVAVISIFAFDFAFVPPYYTLDVHDTAYFITFGVMLVVALTMSRLTARIREQVLVSQQREHRTALLYRLSQELGKAAGADAVVSVAERELGRVLGSDVVIVRSKDDGPMEKWPPGSPFQLLEVRVAAGWALESGEAAGRGTAHCNEAAAVAVPLKTPTRIRGVAVVPLGTVARTPTSSEIENLRVLAEEAALALERSLLAERHELARVEVEAERLRTALLSSLSHDLRTPLGSIEGAASLLIGHEALPADVRGELASSILEESQRMTRLISNLLDMIRVETGALAVKKEWQPLEESLGVALLRLDERLKGHPVLLTMPDNLPLVPIDGLLIEQVFINLLENAVKYTPPSTPITISAWPEKEAVLVEVSDRGPGIPPSEQESVFRKFYRIEGKEGGNGAGLGLTICRGIVVAHGGQIWVESTSLGGATFRFTIPLTGPPFSEIPAEALEAEP